MNIRLYNARILTMEENRDIFQGEIHIQNEKILYVGAGAGLRRQRTEVW